jgi:predicted nucleic acid-binding protein
VTTISNSTALIYLAKLGHLDVLFALYAVVTIPAAVFDETVIQGEAAGREDAAIIRQAIASGQIVVAEADERDLTPEVEALPLGRGERHAIDLARRTSPRWILLDDALARDAASSFGLPVKGTLGVLVEAYRSGLLSREQLEAAFDAILDRDDIWIATALVHRVRENLRHGE